MGRKLITGYALDVNGGMVDGVAVDKQDARDIYQSEIQGASIRGLSSTLPATPSIPASTRSRPAVSVLPAYDT